MMQEVKEEVQNSLMMQEVQNSLMIQEVKEEVKYIV